MAKNVPTVTISFQERFEDETRLDYLQRKLEEARSKSINEDCPVTICGLLYMADVYRVFSLYHGMVEMKLEKTNRDGLFYGKFIVAANFPHQ